MSVRTIARAIKEAGIPARVSRDAGAICLQPSLFRGPAISWRQEVRDPGRLCAFARDARAESARGERKATDVDRSRGRASVGSCGDARPIGSGRGGVSSAPLFLGVDGGAHPLPRAAARRATDGRLPRRTALRRTFTSILPPPSRPCARSSTRFWQRPASATVDRGPIAMGLGLAGFKQGSDQTRVKAAFPGFRLVRAANDATTACIGAHAGADGGLVIAGTGSAAIARVQGKETIIGGRGFALGDDGSGSHIGLDALRSTMRAFDGLQPGKRADRRHPGPIRRRSGRDDELGA